MIRMLIPVLILLALDAYVFKAIYPYLQGSNRGMAIGLILGYWILSIGVVAFLFYGMSTFRQGPDVSQLAMLSLGLFFLFLIPKAFIAISHLLDDLFNLSTWSINKISSSEGAYWQRRDFITKTGLAIGAVLFGGVLYGLTRGKFAWRVIENEVASRRVPKEFDGFKIVQISDAHLGSFMRAYDEVSRMTDIINSLDADLLVFTGDMVNNHAKEAEGWEPVFERMRASMGKFSVFGNHDYGTYGPWTETETADSVSRLKAVHSKMGFNLLEDEHVRIQKGGESIEILGVHNWGKSRHFPKKGDLVRALKGSREDNFKVLLSHDPTHFEEKVMGKENIDLTLSGHTHGCQMGIEIPILNIKFSPVQFVYKRWAGLYQEGNQFLHVNRGMGVLAFPGRVGMAPEISLITLKSV